MLVICVENCHNCLNFYNTAKILNLLKNKYNRRLTLLEIQENVRMKDIDILMCKVKK